MKPFLKLFQTVLYFTAGMRSVKNLHLLSFCVLLFVLLALRLGDDLPLQEVYHLSVGNDMLMIFICHCYPPAWRMLRCQGTEHTLH